LRPLALASCALAIAAFAAASALVYLAGRDPATSSPSWILAPSGRALESAATSRISLSLERLARNDPAPAAALASYRDDLALAADLLGRSLLARPTEPRTLARLAAVRWELDGPLGSGSADAALAMVALASRSAPDSPAVQTLLGNLFLRMARPEDALASLRRAVALEPARAHEAVRALRDHFVPAADILASLPSHPRVLRALATPFVEDGGGDPYLDALEGAIRDGDASLFEPYADVALRLERAARLAAFAASLAAPADAVADAERLLARSRALLALGDPASALEDAKRAAELAPGISRVHEQLGRTRLAGADPAAAVEAFQAALRAAAHEGARPFRRAALTRMLGDAEERAGRPARAFDAYLKTLELDPTDAHARRRIAAMRRAAGVAEPGEPGGTDGRP
jgi:tetratricopeptide (TPR) repeat protein